MNVEDSNQYTYYNELICSTCPVTTRDRFCGPKHCNLLCILHCRFEGGGGSPFLPLPKIFTLALLIMATIMMSTTTPSSLLPLAKASGRCPPSLIRDEQIIEGGVFEMACLKALDLTSQGELIFLFLVVGIRTRGSNVV